METNVRLYSLDFSNIKTFLLATAFIAGNLLLPQLCHLIPNGGLMLLPIYFFTLIAAYKYGLRVGLLTALFSPLANAVFFGMPLFSALPLILIKSGLLAVAAATAARLSGKISLIAIILAVISYQVVGTAFEWVLVKELSIALQSVYTAIPGILIQIFGGYLLLKAMARI